MKIIQIALLSVIVCAGLACQTKKRDSDSSVSGADQQIAGSDAKGDSSIEPGETQPTEQPTDTNITFRLTGGDETKSESAKIVYECKDGFKSQIDVNLNDDGEAQVMAYKDSTECWISLNSFMVGTSTYAPEADESIDSYDIGEMWEFMDSDSKYSVMVVAQLPGDEVHYQYSTVTEESIEDDQNQSNPNQSPNQSPNDDGDANGK